MTSKVSLFENFPKMLSHIWSQLTTRANSYGYYQSTIVVIWVIKNSKIIQGFTLCKMFANPPSHLSEAWWMCCLKFPGMTSFTRGKKMGGGVALFTRRGHVKRIIGKSCADLTNRLVHIPLSKRTKGRLSTGISPASQRPFTYKKSPIQSFKSTAS